MKNIILKELQFNILKLLAIKRVNTPRTKPLFKSHAFMKDLGDHSYTYIYTLNICTNQTSHKLAKNQKCLL